MGLPTPPPAPSTPSLCHLQRPAVGLQRETPARALPAGRTPAAALRKIKIPSAKQAPLFSALFFSSEDTKEFQHRAEGNLEQAINWD